MRVHLFADSPQENWPSMDRYARSLFRALKTVAPEGDFHLLVPPDPPAGLRGRPLVLWRLLVYPLWARRHPADVYHVLDHSYGHLLFALDGSRTVVTVHDVAPFLFPARRWGLSWLAWEVAWRGIQRACRWIADSNFSRSEPVGPNKQESRQYHYYTGRSGFSLPPVDSGGGGKVARTLGRGRETRFTCWALPASQKPGRASVSSGTAEEASK